MAATTTRLTLPYPTPDDTVDVPRDVQALANKLDTLYGGGGAGAGGVLAAQAVLDVGMVNQIRAGRQLAVADFTSMGLGTPVGLWNLGSTANLGSGGTLVNKGAVPFGVGINGVAASAAQFAGSTAQALYIADTGAADPFRIKTGSWGCWFRTAKRGTTQTLVTKLSATASQQSWFLQTSGGNNTALAGWSETGSNYVGPGGVSDVCDDRWHFAVVTVDGTTGRLYVDGVLEGSSPGGLIFGGSGPLNIGASNADAGVASGNPHYGRIDEAFVTADVLSDDQVRALYCAKIPHSLAAVPIDVRLNVRRRKRGSAWAVADFPTQPLRLYNFTAGDLAGVGSDTAGNRLLTNSGGAVLVAGADGTPNEAFSIASAAQTLVATDAGLPSGTATRSLGAWFKNNLAALASVSGVFLSYGSTGNQIYVHGTTGALVSVNAGDAIGLSGSVFVADGQWHFAVVVEDNAAGDGVKRKLYCDGRLVGGSTVLNAIALGGTNYFRLGTQPGGVSPFIGQVDGAFVCGYALTFEQQAALYAKGSQALTPSPKNPGDHVEGMDAAAVYATFDTLDSTHQIDLGVTA